MQAYWKMLIIQTPKAIIFYWKNKNKQSNKPNKQNKAKTKEIIKKNVKNGWLYTVFSYVLNYTKYTVSHMISKSSFKYTEEDV